jgi:hypothetical protein
MMNAYMRNASIGLILCSICLAQVAASDARFVQKLALPGNQTVVIAEGDFESRSIGSYSIRLYSTRDALPGDDTTFFI